MELPVPTHFRCPISLDLMTDPVTAPSGITYDRQTIETWLELGHWTCPVTGQPILAAEELIPNHSMRRMIQDWCVTNRALGVERIPTPRLPVTRAEASGILAEISSASRSGDLAQCAGLASRLKALGMESSRNRQCIASAGAGRHLSAAFRELAGESTECSTTLGSWEEILSALVAFFPLDSEALRHVGSRGSLKSIVSMLRSRDHAPARLTAALVVRELVTGLDPEGRESMAKTNGLKEELVKLIEKPVSVQATKTTLVTLFLLVPSSESTASKFVELGLVSTLVAILVDSDKSTTERALGVLDGLFSCGRGREEGRGHALAVPVLVKRMIRVSEAATDLAVSALWRLCSNGGGRRECVVEALQVGAFQKLLLLLQVGCGGRTKERASDLLRLLNGSRGSVECIETVDFKGLIKRPF